MSYPPPNQPAPQPGWVPPVAPPGYGAPTYGAPGYGHPPRVPGLASYGKRVGAYLIDYLVLGVLVGVAVIVLVTGPTELVACDLDEDGNIAIFGEDAVQPGICERPTGGTIAAAGGLGFLAVVFWFAYHAWEGATGKSVGKLAVGIRLADKTSMQPIGGWKGVGRGVVEWLLSTATCGLGGLLDVLWPLWDADKQTIHDKAVSGVVVEAAYLQSKGSAPTSGYGAPPPGTYSAPLQPSYNAPPQQPAHGGPPQQPSYGTPPGPPTTPPPPPPPPGAPGSPTDPFGNPTSGPPRF